MHFPNGEMCMRCTKANELCCELPFERMPVIERYADGDVMVRCTSYNKREVLSPPKEFHETVGY